LNPWKEKVNHIEEVTGWRIREMEETVQNLQKEIDILQEKSLKPTILASSTVCSNIKPSVYDGKTKKANLQKLV